MEFLSVIYSFKWTDKYYAKRTTYLNSSMLSLTFFVKTKVVYDEEH